jgi:hypothetical protein
MKRIPRLTDDAVFYLTVIIVTIALIILIGEVTGIADFIISSVE